MNTWDCSKKAVNFAYETEGEGCCLHDLKKQIFKKCCTSERVSKTESRIRICDGNGMHVKQKLPEESAKGYTLS